jgi:hypothetical protein
MSMNQTRYFFEHEFIENVPDLEIPTNLVVIICRPCQIALLSNYGCN